MRRSLLRVTVDLVVRDGTRLVWLLGITNGLLAIGAVNATYTALSSPGFWFVPWWLAVPYGAFTAWRASAYVRALLSGSASHRRPPLEGFALMALSTLAYGMYMALRAGFTGPSLVTAMLLYSFYAMLAGCFGILVAVDLMLFDIAVVNRWLTDTKDRLHHEMR